MPKELSIGDVARETGCKVQTIRYYEQIGLMPEPIRTSGNQRRFGPKHVERLSFVRHCRELGFALDAIRELLDLSDNPSDSCEAADAIAQTHLQQVNSRIERLQALKVELERMIKECAGGLVAECRVMESLSDHSLCMVEHHSDPSEIGANT